MNVAMLDRLFGEDTHADAEAHESANLQNRLMSFILSMEPATALAMRGSLFIRPPPEPRPDRLYDFSVPEKFFRTDR